MDSQLYTLLIAIIMQAKLVVSFSYTDHSVECRGSYVNQFRLLRGFNSHGILGIGLRCAKWEEAVHSEDIETVKNEKNGTWGDWYNSQTGNQNVAIGWQFTKHPPGPATPATSSIISNPDLPIVNLGLRFNTEDSPTYQKARFENEEVVATKTCNLNHAICGVTVKRLMSTEHIFAVDFKCCYYCNPEESYVTTSSFVNEGDTPTTHTARTLVGSQRDNSSTKGESTKKIETTETVKSKTETDNTEHGWNLLVYTGSKSWSKQDTKTDTTGNHTEKDTNWQNSESFMSMKQEEQTFTYTCEPHHRCTLEQLVQTCGGLVLKTPQVRKKSVALQVSSQKETPGESQVENNNYYPPIPCIPNCLQTETIGQDGGYWGVSGVCPHNSIVTSIQLKHDPGEATNILVGILLQCGEDIMSSNTSNLTLSVQAGVKTFSPSEWSHMTYHGPAIGFHVKYHNMTRAITNFALVYNNVQFEVPKQEKTLGGWSDQFICPIDHAICGVQPKVWKNGHIEVIKSLRVKCCFHCQPEEKWIVVDEVENGGYTESSHTTRTTQGSRGEDNVQKGTSDTLSTMDEYDKLRLGFEAKFGSTSSNNFNWATTSTTSWHRETDKSFAFTCEPRHHCTIKQLVGVCGYKEFKTTFLNKTSRPLDPPLPAISNPDTHLGSLKSYPLIYCNPPETCIGPTLNSRGLWQKPQLCPPNWLLTGIELRQGPQALRDISITCLEILVKIDNVNMTTPNVTVQNSEVKSNDTVHTLANEGDKPAVGFYMKINIDPMTMTTITNFAVQLIDENSVHLPDLNSDFGNWTNQLTCPPNHVICGIQTKMYPGSDKNSDWMTDCLVKCCHYCVPQEKMVYIANIENGGYSDMTQSIRATIGTSQNKGQHDSTYKTLGQTSDAEGLHSSFSAKFGNSSYHGFSWDDTASSMWTEETEKSLSFQCEPRHVCTLRQLVGHCGLEEVKTPHIVKTSSPLDDYIPPSISTPYIRDAVDIGSDVHSDGNWTEVKYCPENWLAIGFKVKEQTPGRLGLGDISMECSLLTHTEPRIHQVTEIRSGVQFDGGHWSDLYRFIGDDNTPQPAIGFAVKSKLFTHIFDPRPNHTINFGLHFRRAKSIDAPGIENQDYLWNEKYKCPKGRAVCGIQTKILPKFPDENLVTSIRLKCCPFCVPTEEKRTIDTFYNYGTTETSHRVTLVQSTQDDTRRERTKSFDQAGYAAKYGPRHLSHFNEEESASTSRSNQTDSTIHYDCEPRHACYLQRVVEICGGNITNIRILKELYPLDVADGVYADAPKVDIGPLDPNHNYEGDWEQFEECPGHWIVDGFSLKMETLNSTAFLRSIALQCVPPQRVLATMNNSSFIVSGDDGLVGDWFDGDFIVDENNFTVPAIGFALKYEDAVNTTGSNTKIVDFKLNHDQEPEHLEGDHSTGKWSPMMNCPSWGAICGMKTKFHDSRLYGRIPEDVILTCCFHCRPTERLETLESVFNDGDTETMLKIDLQTGVAGRTPASESGSFSQLGFSTMFSGGEHANGFDWKDASQSLWTTKGSKTINFNCPPHHSCTIKQLVGVCGNLVVNTPHILRHSVLIKSSHLDNPPE